MNLEHSLFNVCLFILLYVSFGNCRKESHMHTYIYICLASPIEL